MLTSTIARSQRVLFVVRAILAGALIAVAVIVALAAPAATASAAPVAPTCSNTITVMNGNDSGAGSLRQAIDDVCEGGTIYFDHDMTVTLASMIMIDKGLTIEGQEKDVTISGNQATRIFFILVEADHVNLNRLTIADGRSPDATPGGGIFNYGSLIVESCTLINNVTGGDGGAIYNTGSGSLYVRNSTLTNNRAGGNGGAIYDLTDFTLGLRNVTLTGNAATRAGGVWLADSGLASRYAYNTIIADQLTGGNCNAPFDGSSNLSNSTSCGSSFTKVDAVLLGSLGDYGGVTRSIPLLPGSPAIDEGNNYNCAGNGFDQRGFPRVGRCDIGAFESQGFDLTVAGGNNQSTLLTTAFLTPLSVNVAPRQPGEPVNGGQITFTAPPSGASAALDGSPATISGGSASVTATANSEGGTFNVTARAGGAAADATFILTNTGGTAVRLSGLYGEAAAPGWIWAVAAFAGALVLAGVALGCIARARRA